jgi:hypothetical protein
VFTSLIRRYAETIVGSRWLVLGLMPAIMFGSLLGGIALIRPRFIVGRRNAAPGEPVLSVSEGV